MKRKMARSLWLSLLLVFFVSAVSCKDEVHTPVLQFKSGGAYVSDSAVIPFGEPVVFGLSGDGGGVNLTMLRVTVESEAGIKTILDTGMNLTGLDWTRVFAKGDGWNELWTFTVMNRDREQTSVSMRIFKDSASSYGEITSLPSVLLGLQQNLSTPNFLDPATGLTYLPAGVTSAVEGTLDIACYYDASDSYTIFSPGCALSETYYSCFSSWTLRNYTAWDIGTTVSAAAFDAAANDSILVASYNDVYGKKKYKFLTPNLVIPFKTAAGKLGLVKVVDVNGNETGTVELAVKIQK